MMKEAMNATERSLKLREGLGQMYTAQMLMAICLVLMFIPVINLIAVVLVLVGGIMSLLAILKLRNVSETYDTAFGLVIVNLVISLFGGMFGGVMETILGLASSICSLGYTYCIINATNDFLREADALEVVARGEKAWKITLVTTVANMVLDLLGLLLSSEVAGLILMFGIAALALSIWGVVVYINYLGKAKDCF